MPQVPQLEAELGFQIRFSSTQLKLIFLMWSRTSSEEGCDHRLVVFFVVLILISNLSEHTDLDLTAPHAVRT